MSPFGCERPCATIVTVDNYKGVGVLFVRSQVRELPPSARERFLEALSPDGRDCFERAVATQWVPVELATECFEALAEVAYAASPDPMRAVGVALARNDLRGVYRFLVRLATVKFLLQQHTKLWSTYHREGEAQLESRGDRAVQVKIVGHPRLPRGFRECLAGWLEGALQVCGARDIVVKHDVTRPPPWAFDINWG